MIGRNEEKLILENLIQSKKSEFVAVYGRRRVGKTYFIREVVKNNLNGFSFDLEKSNVKEKIVNKIEFVSKNKKLQKKIINNAFNYSLNFSWSTNIKKILKACL